MNKYFVCYQYLYQGLGEFMNSSQIIEYPEIKDTRDLRLIEIELDKEHTFRKYITILNIYKLG